MLNREIAPEIKLPSELFLPNVETVKVNNGVDLHVLNVGAEQVVRVSIVFKVGSKNQQKAFQASSVINMLSEGSDKYNSEETAQRLDFYGIYYDTNIDRDFCMITIGCLKKFLPTAIDMLEEILCHPLFLQNDFDIYRQKRIQYLSVEREKPAFLARELFAKKLFGDNHPYGVTYSADMYNELITDDLFDFYNRFLIAQNAFVVTSGAVGKKEVDMIVKFIEKLPQGEKNKSIPLDKPESEKIGNIERAGEQSSVRMGKILFPKGHEDFNAMQVLSMILGGYFGSRLVQNIREEKGYTYGIYCAMVNLENHGYIAISTEVAIQHTQDTINEIILEINRLRNELVSDDELEVVKSMIIGELMRILDGPFGITDVVIENIQTGVDPRYLNDFLQEVIKITPEKIKSLALKYLDPQTLTTVVVGAKIKL